MGWKLSNLNRKKLSHLPGNVKRGNSVCELTIAGGHIVDQSTLFSRPIAKQKPNPAKPQLTTAPYLP